MFPTSASAGDQIRTRMVAAARAETAACESACAPDAANAGPERKLLLPAATAEFAALGLAQATAGPRRDLLHTPELQARTLPAVSPYLISLAPLRTLAGLFMRLVPSRKKQEPIPPAAKSTYEVREPDPASRTQYAVSTDSGKSLEVATRAAYNVLLRDAAETQYTCSVPTRAVPVCPSPERQHAREATLSEVSEDTHEKPNPYLVSFPASSPTPPSTPPSNDLLV